MDIDQTFWPPSASLDVVGCDLTGHRSSCAQLGIAAAHQVLPTMDRRKPVPTENDFKVANGGEGTAPLRAQASVCLRLVAGEGREAVHRVDEQATLGARVEVPNPMA
jgi:hypothetical protein